MRVTASYLENLALDWQRAYKIANGKDAPSVVWENGWFLISSELSGRKDRFRRSALEAMRDTLQKRQKESTE